MPEPRKYPLEPVKGPSLHVLALVGQGLTSLSHEASKIDATLLWARVAAFVEASPEGQMEIAGSKLSGMGGGRIVRADIVTGALLAHVVQLLRDMPMRIRVPWLLALARDLEITYADVGGEW